MTTTPDKTTARQPIPDLGPEPASRLPWRETESFSVVPSGNTTGAAGCDHGCDGGCDEDPRERVQCRTLDHCDDVVCDTYGIEGFAQRDAQAIAYRVNNWEALHAIAVAERERADLVEAERDEWRRLAELRTPSQWRAEYERLEAERDELRESAEHCAGHSGSGRS